MMAWLSLESSVEEGTQSVEHECVQFAHLLIQHVHVSTSAAVLLHCMTYLGWSPVHIRCLRCWR